MEKRISEKEVVQEFMNYLRNNSNDSYDEKEEVIKKFITQIFQMEIEEIGYHYNPDLTEDENDIGLEIKDFEFQQFYGLQHSGKDIINKKVIIEKPKIAYNLGMICEKLVNSDENTRQETLKFIFHEIQHQKQHFMVDIGISNKTALMYARDFVLYDREDCIQGFYHEGKNHNYASFITENDANYVAYSKLYKFLGTPELKHLRDIELGKKYSLMYKADATLDNGKVHYLSNGLGERNDITIPILDDIICKRGFIEYLQLFPILQKEYNLDGTKKNVIELVQNMNQEVSDLTQSDLPNKELLIEDSKEMYYELIYRELEKSSQKQLEEYTQRIGKSTLLQISQEINQYFNNEEQIKIEKTAKMNEAYNRMGKYTIPYNNGTIKVEQDGKIVDMNVDEFVKTLRPDLLNKEFVSNSPMISMNEKDLITGDKYVRDYLFQYMSKTGKVNLNDGRSYTAKQYIEEILNSSKKLDTFSLTWKVKREFKSEDYEEEQKDFEKRIHKYYSKKHKFIDEIIDRVSSPENYEENPLFRIYDEQQVVILESEYSKSQTISMKSVVSNAITQGIATEDVRRIDNEEHRKLQENQIEGETKDD